MCKRQNRNILAILRRLSDNHPSDWHLHLEACANALNGTVIKATGLSPFECVHGVRMRQAYQIEPPTLRDDMPANQREAVEFWQSRLTVLREEAVIAMNAARVEQTLD